MNFVNILKLDKTKIFLISFLILYLELIFIRLFPAQITLLGFYTNFILIATFAGIGLGFLLSKYKTDLKTVFPWLFLLIFHHLTEIVNNFIMSRLSLKGYQIRIICPCKTLNTKNQFV